MKSWDGMKLAKKKVKENKHRTLEESKIQRLSTGTNTSKRDLKMTCEIGEYQRQKEAISQKEKKNHVSTVFCFAYYSGISEYL